MGKRVLFEHIVFMERVFPVASCATYPLLRYIFYVIVDVNFTWPAWWVSESMRAYLGLLL